MYCLYKIYQQYLLYLFMHKHKEVFQKKKKSLKIHYVTRRLLIQNAKRLIF